MVEIIIGALAATGLITLIQTTRKRSLAVTWWQWLLTVLGFVYAAFVAEVVVSFLREGVPKGAAVMGTLLGFVAVVWGVLLARFVFTERVPAKATEHPASDNEQREDPDAGSIH